MKLRTYHSKPFNHRYLLVCILSGLYFQPAWAAAHSVAAMTRSVTGHAPTAAPVLDNTSPVADQTLTADPQFYDVDGDAMSPDNTLYEWQVQDSPGGSWRKIADAKPGSDPTSKKYKVWVGYIGNSLRVAVRPAGYSSEVDPYLGEWAYSTATNPVQGRAPEAQNVTTSGTAVVGQQLTGNYTFSDADGDTEAGSTYKWYRDGQAIPNATGKTYTIASADQGKKLTFGVTPKSSTGTPNVGAEVKAAESATVQGRAPEAQNVTISGTAVVGQQLTGNYTFSDADGDSEGGSVYKWYRAGQEIGSQSQKAYTLTSADQHKIISFGVTPKSISGNPYAGVEVKIDTVMVFVAANGVKFAKPDSTSRDWSRANSYCSGLALDGGGWRMPNRAQLKALYSAYPNNKVSSVLGWPSKEYWTGEQVPGRLAYYTINLSNGRESSHPDMQPYYTVCIR